MKIVRIDINCHNVKIDNPYFEAVLSGSKTFEIRINDRNYKQGDFIVLHEYENKMITGRSLEKRIGFLTDYEQHTGYVVFSLLDFK